MVELFQNKTNVCFIHVHIGIFNPHMAPPTMSVQSVQFQQVMQSQPQVVENPQIIEQQPQPNFQTQIQHINQPIGQPINQQLSQSIQQSINENQQKLNGIPFSVQNVPQPVPYPQQVREENVFL